MKVYLTKPRNHWISPYTIIKTFTFWKDWDKISYSTPWVKKTATILHPISVGIQKVWDIVHPEVKYIKIDGWDVWSMDSTLSPIILPMLKRLKEVKHGTAWTDHADGPWYYRFDENKDEHSYSETGSYSAGRWNWIMDEMIWTFEQLSNEDHESVYWLEHGEIDWDVEPDERGCSEIKWKKESRVDWDGLKKHEEQIQNGLRLFGRYYQNLWD